MIYLGVILAVVFVGFMLFGSDRTHARCGEIWDRYVLTLVRLGWPYAFMLLIYQLVVDGRLVAAIRAASSCSSAS